MYNRCIWLFVVLTISWLKHASSSSTDSSNSNLLLDVLTKSCPSDGIPVCGVRHKLFFLFPNECLLEAVNKDLLLDNTNFKKVPLKYCLNGCQASCSKLNQPICGQNVKTKECQLFVNQCEMMKYVCQSNNEYTPVQISKCESLKNINKRSLNYMRRPIPCTNVLKPVCGIYMGVKSSFRNECLLNAENVKFNRDWRIIKNGMCAEDYSNARQKKEQSMKLHLLKKRSLDNNFHDYLNDFEYDTKNFVDYKSPLYLHIPPAFQTEYLNHDDTSYRQSVPMHELYNEIYNKIIALPEIPNEHQRTDEKKEDPTIFERPLYNAPLVKPLPFSTNGISLDTMPNIRDINMPSEINNLVENINDINSEEREVTTTTFFESTTSSYNTEISDTVTVTNVFEHDNEIEIPTTVKENECKFGSNAVCGTLSNGTVQSFNSICEMMTANINFNDTWVKLHDGVCEVCTYNCSRDYKPICVSRNGVNYTMVNECYYNMAICMDKKSKWLKLSEGQCERYTRIPDKYANMKPGFMYTSSYLGTETTTTSAEPSTTLATTFDKHKQLKTRRIRKRRPNPKRAINRQSGLCKCQTRSRYCKNFTCGTKKCRCDSTTVQSAAASRSLYETTESYIMRIDKDKSK